MIRVLILSELWHPEGGGAELATYLYAKKLLEAGMKVTIASSLNPVITNLDGDFQTVSLGLGVFKSTKASLLFKNSSIKRKLQNLAIEHDVVYITGKMFLLASWLKKINKSLKIVVHLHDYQLICPHASLHNFLEGQTCEFIWSKLDCSRCTNRYQLKEGKTHLSSFLASCLSLAWKQSLNIAEIIEHVDVFVTVSNRQTSLISNNLGDYSGEFRKKTKMIYNPVDTHLEYVSPVLGSRVRLGFFGTEKYVKGFQAAINYVTSSKNSTLSLLATGVTHQSTDERLEFTHFLNKSEMANAFRSVWIVLITSILEEPSPYMVAESQIRGRPVLSSSQGGIPESIVKSEFTGTILGTKYTREFDESVTHYSTLLKVDSGKYTKEVSDMSREFFNARTVSSYDKFMQLVG